MVNLTSAKEKLNILLKESGKDANSLKKADKAYKFVKSLVIYDDSGRKLSITEKFAVLGHERTLKQESPLVKGKRLIEAYIAKGKKVEDLTNKDAELIYLRDSSILDENGRELSLEEKFSAIGYPRKEKRASDVVEKMHSVLEDFEKRTGRKVASLTPKDKEYHYIKGMKLKDSDGRLLTLEEKFLLAGYERGRIYSLSVKDDLIEQVDNFLKKKDASFHIPRKDLPFFPKLVMYQTILRKQGKVKSVEEIMKELGYKAYSDAYYRFKNLENLSLFRDEDGFVDSYRKDKQMKAFVNDYAITVGLPIPVVVMLLCDEKLHDCTLDVEYFSHVKEELEKYIEINGDLKNICKIDSKLYQKLSYIRKYIATEFGDNVSTADILEFLDVDVGNNFKTEAKQKNDIEQEMSRLQKIAKNHDGKIHKKDISDEAYFDILVSSKRLGITTKTFFENYGIDYVDAQAHDRFKKIHVKNYPFLKEMQKRRDALLQESGITKENGCCKEEIFEKRLEVCKQVFNEFKPQIFNFEKDERVIK